MEIKNVLFVHPLEGNAYEIFKAFDRNKEINVIPLLKNKIKTNSTLNISNSIGLKFRKHFL